MMTGKERHGDNAVTFHASLAYKSLVYFYFNRIEPGYIPHYDASGSARVVVGRRPALSAIV
jgi:hypothetical protein